MSPYSLRLAAQVAIIAFVFSLSACEGRGEGAKSKQKGSDSSTSSEAAEAIPVEVALIALGSVNESIFATGKLQSERLVVVTARAAGQLTELTVDEGDLIGEEGAPLGKIQNRQLGLGVNSAQNRIQRLNADRKRLEPLVEKGYIPRADLDRVKTELEIAKEDLQRARVSAGDLRILAPIAGVVASREVEVGAQVVPNQPLLTIIDPDALEVELQIPEHALGVLKTSLAAEVVSEALGAKTFPARVAAIAPTVDPASGTVKVTVSLSEVVAGVEQRLRPGMFVQVYIITDQRSDVVLVPKRAIIYEESKPFVFVLRDDVVERIELELGASQSEHAEARAGLSAGDEVVTLGQASLESGAHVRVVGRPAPEAESTSDASAVPETPSEPGTEVEPSAETPKPPEASGEAEKPEPSESTTETSKTPQTP